MYIIVIMSLFMHGDLLDCEPPEQLHQAGKLVPSSLSRLLDQRDAIVYICTVTDQRLSAPPSCIAWHGRGCPIFWQVALPTISFPHLPGRGTVNGKALYAHLQLLGGWLSADRLTEFSNENQQSESPRRINVQPSFEKIAPDHYHPKP